MAKKKSKMSTSEAVKILATEMKLVKETQQMIVNKVNQESLLLQDYVALFERYIEHTKDGDEFIEKMKKLVEKKQKEFEEKKNEQKSDEQTDGEHTDGDSKDEGVGAEGVRSQEG